MDGLEGMFAGTMTLTVVIVVVSVLCSLALPVLIIGGVIVGNRNRQKRAMDLAQNGVQGMATITSLDDTGMRVNDDPRVRLGMHIELPGYPPYEVTKTLVISIVRLSQLQVGQQVIVFVDPNDRINPDRIALGLR